MRIFLLNRKEDISGVSGVGLVAEAVEMKSGKVIVSWNVPPHSLSIHDSLDAAIQVHGHGGSTAFVEVASRDLQFK